MTGAAVGAGAGAAEWRRHWVLPIAAAAGYATSVIHIYGLGPYIEPLSQEFGWSRTRTTAGLTLSTLIQAVASVPIGVLVDRMGPRRLALVGALLTVACFALLSTATGTAVNWYVLWGLLALATLPVQATVWTSAVASRFDAARGLALAVTLCGASVAVALFPYLGSKLIEAYGWRTAFVAQAALWCAFSYPLIFLFFRGATDRARDGTRTLAADRAPLGGVDAAEGFRSTIYARLFVASLLFTFTIIALVVHFVPLLTSAGRSATAAAGIASLIGVFSIAGRLGTGLLLDRFRASRVGAAVFLLPVAGCLLLIVAGNGQAPAMVAAALIGLTLGAEIDVVAYLTTKHFGLKSFGALYGGLLAALSIGTAAGPLGAARVFDLYGSYEPFLWVVVAGMVVSSLALLSLPAPSLPGERR